MPHKFVIIVDGVVKTYTNYNDIPNRIDHVIEFLPEVPLGPHTDEQHVEIESWSQRLDELIRRENASSGP